MNKAPLIAGLLVLPMSHAQTSDPLAHPIPAYAKKLQGNYDLWQDGEGGATCTLRLTSQRTIGGFAIQDAHTCAERLTLQGTPYAWFVNDQGLLLLLDVTRQPLLRMHALGNREYKDARQGDYINAVILSPAQR